MGLKPLSYDIKRFGSEQEPVIVIDNYTESIERLKRRAYRAKYKVGQAFYPGIQAHEDPNYLGVRGEELTELMSNIFGVTGKIELESCNYSLVCRPRDKLAMAQCLPHYDAHDPSLFAIVHYIQAPENSGTAFYKHKRTGFETITEDRTDIYNRALQDDLADYGPPARDYFYDTNESYEMIGEIKAQPDQLIIYRGYTLHSGCIPSAVELTTNPLKARITLNSFLWARYISHYNG
ncbi:MAG: DUF6445 family protein [Maricaulaceae bacterium]